MKTKLFLLSLLAVSNVLADEIAYESFTLDDPTQTYLWKGSIPDSTDTYLISDSTNTVITYKASEGGYSLYYNRNWARNFAGTIVLEDGAKKNYLYMGYDGATSNLNSFGFYGGKITGAGADKSDLTIVTYSETPNSFFRTAGNWKATITSATVNFGEALANLNFLLTANTTQTFDLKGASVVNWNATVKETTKINTSMAWDSSITDLSTSKILFTTSDATSATVNIGTAAATSSNETSYTYKNLGFQGNSSTNKMNVSFEGASKQIILDSTDAFSAKNVMFNNVPNLALKSGTTTSFENIILNGVKAFSVNSGGAATIKESTFAGTSNTDRANITLSAGSNNVIFRDITISNANVTFNSKVDQFNPISGSTTNVTFNFNEDVLSTTTQVNSGTNVVFNLAAGKTFTTAYRFSTNGLAAFNVGEGAKVVANGSAYTGTNGNNLFKGLNMAKGSSLTVAGGIRFDSANTNVIDGAIYVNGTGRAVLSKNFDVNGTSTKIAYNSYNPDEFIVGLNVSVRFDENASLTQKYIAPATATIDNTLVSTSSQNWLGKGVKVTTASVAGSLNFGNMLYIQGGNATFVMNSSDAYVLGSGEAWKATSQATSVFTLANRNDTNDIGTYKEYKSDGKGTYLSNVSTSTGATIFEINAANSIGAISADATERSVILKFGENGSLVLGEAEGEYFTSLRGNHLTTDFVTVEGDIYQQLKVYDLTRAQIDDYFKAANGNLFIQAIDEANNVYWVNTVVPEPAQWAAIFGGIALAFVAYRRRK